MKTSKVTRIWGSRQKSYLWWKVQLCKPPGFCCMLCPYLQSTHMEEGRQKLLLRTEGNPESSMETPGFKVHSSLQNLLTGAIRQGWVGKTLSPTNKMMWQKHFPPSIAVDYVMRLYAGMLWYSPGYEPFKSDSLCKDIQVLTAYY